MSGLPKDKRHGMNKTRENRTWQRMIERCTSPNDKSWKNYGGRGIKVCNRWLSSFKNFYEDMGPKPPGMSIERINNDGDYEPANCKWATTSEQNRNQRKDIRKKTHCRNGHPLRGANLIIKRRLRNSESILRKCKECEQRREHDYYLRKRRLGKEALI